MKTIIFPTDFSKNAENAMNFAIELANRNGAHLILLNSYELPYADTVMTTSLIEVMRKNSEEQLEELKNDIHKRFPDLDITYHSSMNNPIRAIKNHARKYNADLVVMGTKGASGIQEVLIGSTTASVLSGNVCPVLAIPHKAHLKEMNKAVFFVDGRVEKSDKEALKFLSEFIRLVNAKLEIIHVYDKEGGDIEQPAILKENLDIDFMFANIKADDIEEGMSDYMSESNGDLAVMIKRKYTFIERLFHKSQTTSMAYHSRVPMLAIQEL